MRMCALVVAAGVLVSVSGASAQLTTINLPGSQYRYGKVNSFSPSGAAFTGYIVSDGPGGDSAPRAFSFSHSSGMVLDPDNYTVGLSVSDDGLTGVRAIGSIGAVGVMPSGSKYGPVGTNTGTTLLPFRAIAANPSGQAVVGFDPALATGGGFARRLDEGSVMTMPTLPTAGTPMVTTVSSDGHSMAINFYRTIYEAPTPTVWTSTTGLSVLPTGANADWSAARKISGDGRTVVGFSTYRDENAFLQTVGGYWSIAGGVGSQFVEMPGFSRIDTVSDDGGVMFGYGENGETVWTRGGGYTTLQSYLAAANVQLPGDWSYMEISAMSGDGRSFAGFATLGDGMTDIAFVATIPTPGAALTMAVGGLLAAIRGRRR